MKHFTIIALFTLFSASTASADDRIMECFRSHAQAVDICSDQLISCVSVCEQGDENDFRSCAESCGQTEAACSRAADQDLLDCINQ